MPATKLSKTRAEFRQFLFDSQKTYHTKLSPELMALTAIDVLMTPEMLLGDDDPRLVSSPEETLPDAPDGWSWWCLGGAYCLVQTSGSLLMEEGFIYHTFDFRDPDVVVLWTHQMDNPKALTRLDIPRAKL